MNNLLVFFFFIIQVFSQYTNNKYPPMTQSEMDQLCAIRSSEEFQTNFTERVNQIYGKKCGTQQYYRMKDGEFTCFYCFPGTYIRDNLACCGCGSGAITSASGYNSMECTQCEQGYGSNAERTACEICPYGTYSIGKGMGCIDCGNGKYTETKGASYCLDCPEGYQRNANGDGCEICPQGTYSLGGKGLGCQKCNNGTIAPNPGSKTCEPCPAGKGANSARTKCEDCIAGTYSKAPGEGCHFCESPGNITLSAGQTK